MEDTKYQLVGLRYGRGDMDGEFVDDTAVVPPDISGAAFNKFVIRQWVYVIRH